MWSLVVVVAVVSNYSLSHMSFLVAQDGQQETYVYDVLVPPTIKEEKRNNKNKQELRAHMALVTRQRRAKSQELIWYEL